MAGTAVSGRLSWQTATVRELVTETPRTRSIVLDVPNWPGHLAGQHVDLRLTAEDGYQAQRSYSIASAPEDRDLVLTVARVDDGEVSPYLVDDLQPGDELEVRGPIGGYFAWEDRMTGPVLLVGGGSGVVPLRSMLRHHRASQSTLETRLIYSVRSPEDVIYRDELTELAGDDTIDVRLAFTRTSPPEWDGLRGRIDAGVLDDLGWDSSPDAVAFICGPNGFVEFVAQSLVALGHPPRQIKTERFG
ncbi:MAG TPA: ferredoxin reductase [Solirubrobacteraceae bacterium]|nr:ferredoxin reductase [Solirubrobacteraceae bacterium]